MHEQILTSLLTLLSFFYHNSSNTDNFSRGLKVGGFENSNLQNSDLENYDNYCDLFPVKNHATILR